jgi:hypothetical protein
VKASPGIADILGECTFDIHMHIFKRVIEGEYSAQNPLLNFL